MNNEYSDSILTIDLAAIAENYKILQKQAPNSEAAAVVKANAYGLGVEKIAPVLWDAGCRKFFVANLDEAVQLRSVLPEAFVAVFHGIRKGQGSIFKDKNLVPVLNSPEQIEVWQKSNKGGNCILHFDTGMTRLGLSERDAENFDFSQLNIEYVMSHLACADDKGHELNREQLNKIIKINRIFPKIKVSLCNSYGAFLGGEYHFDLIRPGMALYGVNPVPERNNPMKSVVKVIAKILQIHKIDSNRAVGYGASYNLKTGVVTATIPVGYADGYLRYLGNKGFCAIDGVKVPVIGRVSMDLITLDVTKISGIKAGDEVEIIGDTIKVDDVAEKAATIGYEILTSLGQRYKRIYVK